MKEKNTNKNNFLMFSFIIKKNKRKSNIIKILYILKSFNLYIIEEFKKYINKIEMIHFG